MILNVMKKDFIQLNVEANDWKEAIRMSAAPLLSKSVISENYIDAIIESAVENGPYFVLIPHVALPHARSEKGALENAIGLTTLKNPVKFNNEANDPVKYIFILSSTTEDGHLQTMAELSMLLESPEFYQCLDEAASVEDVVRFIERGV